MAALVNHVDEIDGARYWAAMKKNAARALDDVRTQRMALDVEVARWKRSGLLVDTIEPWADEFAEIETKLRAFVDECDARREAKNR